MKIYKNCYLKTCTYCESDNLKEDLTFERLENNISLETLKDIVSNIKNLPQKTKYTYTAKNVANRLQMLEWIENVCIYLNLSDDTLYTTIEIYDEVLKKFFYNLSNDDFVLIGLTCIFISSKLHEGKTINIDFLLKAIVHGKFERDDLLMTELLILKTLNFRIPINYFLSFVNCLLGMILPTLDCVISNKIYKNIKSMYSMIKYDFQFEKYDKLLIYTSLVYFGVSELEMNSKMKFDEIIIKLTKCVKMYRVKLNRSILITKLFEQFRM
jgi:hypothetical protein